MKYTLYLKQNQVDELEYEVVSTELRVHLIRLLSQGIKGEWTIVIQNHLINKARSFIGLPIYVLESDIMGEYEPQEYAWHNGEFELLLRRFNTTEIVEFLGFLIEEGFFTVEEINDLLVKDGLSFYFERTIIDKIKVCLTPLDDISEQEEREHPNIRVLVRRMEDALKREDCAGVLHTSASIFETLAKDIIGIPSVQNQTLKSFFERYRNDSKLPDEILNYILDLYNSRNTTPLAGHGSTKNPEISKDQATILSEMTKAFVKIEYKLNIEVPRLM
ncbi:hypothetical protein [Nostoc parmelioides]|uniref:Uncharacterized protein n=1 Tax=Nostoc parmelioides FACHB-3921 TaxID=2692909 RepID=A0ABR8BDU2_9NOSO|nr:hypothetical protein [Nostoc parmelioides]MBD2251940.1 hypothetical protein [Nostoc parmelioides FACHB-3921]